MSDVFISYNRKDRVAAEQVEKALLKLGVSVWRDVKKIKTGDTFNQKIEEAISVAKCVIVLWSPRSVVSEYVCLEAEFARRKKKLLPVMIEQADTPFQFGLLHTTNLSAWDGSISDPEFEQLIEAIRERGGLVQPQKTSKPSESRHEARKEQQPHAPGRFFYKKGLGRTTRKEQFVEELASELKNLKPLKLKKPGTSQNRSPLSPLSANALGMAPASVNPKLWQRYLDSKTQPRPHRPWSSQALATPTSWQEHELLIGVRLKVGRARVSRLASRYIVTIPEPASGSPQLQKTWKRIDSRNGTAFWKEWIDPCDQAEIARTIIEANSLLGLSIESTRVERQVISKRGEDCL